MKKSGGLKGVNKSKVKMKGDAHAKATTLGKKMSK